MKKILWVTSMLLFFFILSAATFDMKEEKGIIFFEGTWHEAMKQAAKENKLIFLDISTSWCGYCKKMKQNTFTDKKVGAYFNKRFVNIELDGEHGEGLRLAHKFGVSEYPTLLLIDKKENAMLTSEGYHDADDLIKLFQMVGR